MNEKVSRIYALKSHCVKKKDIDEGGKEHKTSEISKLLEKDRGYHYRINPEELYIFFGDVDQKKDGTHTTKEIFSKALIAFMKEKHGEELSEESFCWTSNTGKVGSFHYSIPELNCKASTLLTILQEFKSFNENLSEFVDTGIYGVHWWRLPNQTSLERKTPHVVVGGMNRISKEEKKVVLEEMGYQKDVGGIICEMLPSELQDFVIDLIPKYSRNIDTVNLSIPEEEESEDEEDSEAEGDDEEKDDPAKPVSPEPKPNEIEIPIEGDEDEDSEEEEEEIEQEEEEKNTSDRDIKIIRAFKKLHPKAEYTSKTEYDNSIKFDFKYTIKDKCIIHKRTHKSNRNYAIFYINQQKAFYKCYDDDCPKKILLIDFNKKVENRNSFDKTDNFVFEDFVKKYAGEVFKNKGSIL